MRHDTIGATGLGDSCYPVLTTIRKRTGHLSSYAMMDYCGFIMVDGRELSVYRRILIGRAALGEQSEMARCSNCSAGLAVTGSEYDTGEQFFTGRGSPNSSAPMRKSLNEKLANPLCGFHALASDKDV